MTVASGPRQADVEHAVTNEVGTVRTAVCRTNLQRNILRLRDLEHSLELRGRRYRRVVEPANNRALAQRCVRESRRLHRRIRRNKRVDTVNAFDGSTVMLAHRDCAFETG